MARRADHEEGGIVRLTARGEIVLATLATLALIALMGVAGWIEGGMQ